MSRTKTPEQYEAEYNFLTPSQAGERLGVAASTICELIRNGHLTGPGVLDVSRSSKPRYRISEKALERYLQASEERVLA